MDSKKVQGSGYFLFEIEFGMIRRKANFRVESLFEKLLCRDGGQLKQVFGPRSCIPVSMDRESGFLSLCFLLVGGFHQSLA